MSPTHIKRGSAVHAGRRSTVVAERAARQRHDLARRDLCDHWLLPLPMTDHRT
jgi:hypothetical protein